MAMRLRPQCLVKLSRREETKLPGFIFPLPFEALGGRHNKAISGNIPI